jgi:hypothetical protein
MSWVDCNAVVDLDSFLVALDATRKRGKWLVELDIGLKAE